MKQDAKLGPIIFGILKITLALFVIRVVFNIMGFPGYIPVVDEVYNFIMGLVLSASGNRNALPHGL